MINFLQGAAGVAVQYLGYTPGLFIVGLFAILILWMYANFWITGTLFIVGGMAFSISGASCPSFNILCANFLLFSLFLLSMDVIKLQTGS